MDDDTEEYKSPLAGDDCEEDPLYDEDEEFEGKLEEYNPENMPSSIHHPKSTANGHGHHATTSSDMSNILSMLKKEIKQEPSEMVIKTEPGLHANGGADPMASMTTNTSAWQSVQFIKQEPGEPSSTKHQVDPLAVLMAGNNPLNRNFEVKQEAGNSPQGHGITIPPAPILFPGMPTPQQLQGSEQHAAAFGDVLSKIDQQMQNMTKTMSGMASLIQTQRAEIQVYKIWHHEAILCCFDNILI